ncbi:2-dehydro-3-deoxygluconokinase [Sphingobium sp. B1D7B]|uniref:sugar kinase n=1 Tax=unclassified Sphingobium TaxID=2611147 RepID=UPI00222405B6|nr:MULTISPECIES: sugar kinase [unclassified Sphingobium]MCW2392821.1 2-dehydro-3-deoxygluconokinase [Sphingobium sp. B11D3A]MCW2404555.1 2-dehydro-3-deoxygluconokinase [Sphingobium sp. B1D7B]
MRVLAIGEGMVEFRREDACWRQAHGGDVVNTAVHLARFGIATGLATAIGRDGFSDFLAAQWQGEGLDLSCVARSPAHECGIYFIATDERGERSFTYRRSDSAARRLVSLIAPDTLAAAVRNAELIVYFSLVTLAILPEEDRATLLDILRSRRAAGGRIAFDSNYRPALWETVAAARHWHDAALRTASIGLPTLDDEQALLGTTSCEEAITYWRERGVDEVAVKMGATGAMAGDCLVPTRKIVARPLDTSGAGDAFNGGYLAHRLVGRSPEASAEAGNALAAWVVQRRGAIPPAEAGIYSRPSGDDTGMAV